jgi:hypothetical protein
MVMSLQISIGSDRLNIISEEDLPDLRKRLEALDKNSIRKKEKVKG